MRRGHDNGPRTRAGTRDTPRHRERDYPGPEAGVKTVRPARGPARRVPGHAVLSGRVRPYSGRLSARGGSAAHGGRHDQQHARRRQLSLQMRAKIIRRALALRVGQQYRGQSALADQDDTPLMVFDEIDANVGGEVAKAVGRKMAALGTRHQVVAITHFPQVAAMSAHHFVVEKEVSGGRTRSRLFPVSGETRIQELVRMLGGGGEQARAMAASLLNP